MQKVCHIAALTAGCLVLSTQPALAQQNFDALEVFVGGHVTRDDNLFRVEEESQIPTVGAARGLDDLFYGIYGGLDSNWIVSDRNRFRFDAVVRQDVYAEYNELDHTSGDILARYDYVGRRFEFFTAFSFVEERVNFENQLNPRIDFRTRERLQAGFRTRLGLNWSFGLQAGHTDIEFDLATPVERDSAAFDFTYRSRQGNTLGLVANFQERTNSGNNSLGFKEYLVGPELMWKVSRALQLDAALKMQERTPSDRALTEFQGAVGNFRVQLHRTESTTYSVEVFRRVSSLGDQLSNFAIVDGGTIRGEWGKGDKLGFHLGLSHERRDFEEEPNVVPLPGFDVRQDDLTTVTAGVEWRPRRSVEIEFAAAVGDRSSNRALQDFRYETLSVGFRFDFM